MSPEPRMMEIEYGNVAIELPEIRIEEFGRYPGSLTLASGDKYKHVLPPNDHVAFNDAIRCVTFNGKSVLVDGKIIYEDIFGQSHSVYFRYVTFKKSTIDTIRFNSTGFGNFST